MTPAPPIRAWAIKAPDGEILLDTLGESKTGTIIYFTDGNRDWSRRMKEGYRCVRVSITETEAQE